MNPIATGFFIFLCVFMTAIIIIELREEKRHRDMIEKRMREWRRK